MNNNFSIKKGNFNDLKSWTKYGLSLLFRRPFYSSFLFLCIYALSKFSDSIAATGDDLALFVFYSCYWILIPTVLFFISYSNDHSIHLKDFQFSKIIPSLPKDYVYIFVFFAILSCIFLIIPDSTTSTATMPPETQNKETEFSWFEYFLIDLKFIYFFSASFCFYMFIGIPLKITFYLMPNYLFDIKTREGHKDLPAKEVIDKGISDNLKLFFVPCFIIYFVFFILSDLFDFNESLKSILNILFTIVFYNIVYVAIKDLIGAGGIKEKKTVSVFSKEETLIPVKVNS